MPQHQSVWSRTIVDVETATAWKDAELFSEDQHALSIWSRHIPRLDPSVSFCSPGRMEAHVPFSACSWETWYDTLQAWTAPGTASVKLYSRVDTGTDERLVFPAQLSVGVHGRIGVIGWTSKGEFDEATVDQLLNILRLHNLVSVDDGILTSSTTDVIVNQVIPGNLCSAQIHVMVGPERVFAHTSELAMLGTSSFDLGSFAACIGGIGGRWAAARDLMHSGPDVSVYYSDGLLAKVSPAIPDPDDDEESWTPFARWTRLERVKGYPDPMETSVVCGIQHVPGRPQTLTFHSNDMRVEDLINDVTTRTGLDVEPGDQ